MKREVCGTFTIKVPVVFSTQFYRKSKLRPKFKRSAFNSLFKMKEEKVEVDETFSIKFEDPIPAKRIKQEPQEPLEERKAVVEVATQTENFETELEGLKAEILNLKERVNSGFEELGQSLANIQKTIEKSDGVQIVRIVRESPNVNALKQEGSPGSLNTSHCHPGDKESPGKCANAEDDDLDQTIEGFDEREIASETANEAGQIVKDGDDEYILTDSSTLSNTGLSDWSDLSTLSPKSGADTEDVELNQEGDSDEGLITTDGTRHEERFDESEIASKSGSIMGDGTPGGKSKRVHGVYGAKSTATKTRRCGECIGCQRKNCGKCPSCQDMPKFGGRGLKKQACIWRICRWVHPGGKTKYPRDM